MIRRAILAWALVAGAPIASATTVMFDQAHGERFVVEGDGPLDLTVLASRFHARGARIEVTRDPLTRASLANVDVLVVSGAFVPFAAEEVRAVAAFVERGGRLVVTLHIGPPAVGLLEPFGVGIWGGVVRDGGTVLAGEPLHFEVEHLEAHPLTRGLERFRTYGSWALEPLGSKATTVASTGDSAWLDVDGDGRRGPGEVTRRFAVVVAGERGAGRVAVFGDDAVFQNQFLVGDNLRLADNLVDWLLARSPLAHGGRELADSGRPTGS